MNQPQRLHSRKNKFFKTVIYLVITCMNGMGTNIWQKQHSACPLTCVSTLFINVYGYVHNFPRNFYLFFFKKVCCLLLKLGLSLTTLNARHLYQNVQPYIVSSFFIFYFYLKKMQKKRKIPVKIIQEEIKCSILTV
jgi:chloramphenicol O-acetyltransferase